MPICKTPFFSGLIQRTRPHWPRRWRAKVGTRLGRGEDGCGKRFLMHPGSSQCAGESGQPMNRNGISAGQRKVGAWTPGTNSLIPREKAPPAPPPREAKLARTVAVSADELRPHDCFTDRPATGSASVSAWRPLPSSLPRALSSPSSPRPPPKGPARSPWRPPPLKRKPPRPPLRVAGPLYFSWR